MTKPLPCSIVERDGTTGFTVLRWGSTIHRKQVLVDALVPKEQLRLGFTAVLHDESSEVVRDV